MIKLGINLYILKKMKTITSTILILFALISHANDIKYISINKKAVSKIATNFYFEKVIDWRTTQNSIGYCQTGGLNKRKDLQFESQFCTEIETYYNNKITVNLNSQKLYLIITNFWVSERTTAWTEKGLFTMSALICSKDSLGNFNQLYEYERFIEESNMVDVTAGHVERITNSLNGLINEFSAVLPQNYENMTIFEASFNEADNISNAKYLEPGFYKNFVELFNNKPSVKPIQTLKLKHKISNTYVLKDTLTKKRIGNFYGYCNGEDIFINVTSYGGFYNIQDKKYTKVLTIGKYLFIDDDYLDNATGAISSQFGLVGGLIAAANTKLFGILDTKTGKYTFFSERSFKEFLMQYTELYEKYKKIQNIDNNIRAQFVKKINQIERDKIKQ